MGHGMEQSIPNRFLLIVLCIQPFVLSKQCGYALHFGSVAFFVLQPDPFPKNVFLKCNKYRIVSYLCFVAAQIYENDCLKKPTYFHSIV